MLIDPNKLAASLAAETVESRAARLNTNPPEEARLKSLTIAHPLVDDATFIALASAIRVSRLSTIVIPRHRFENLSRGKGWCRKGRGDKAEWGERTSDGYRVSPGKWTVHGNDGFSRSGQDVWDVEHVTVGDAIWTVAS